MKHPNRDRSESRCRLVAFLGRDRVAEWRAAVQYREHQVQYLTAECKCYREALEKIAGPVDSPRLSYDGKLAARALDREPASPEQVAERAARDYEHYLRGIVA